MSTLNYVNIKKVTNKLMTTVWLLIIALLAAGCGGSQMIDGTLKTKSYVVRENKVKRTTDLPYTDLTAVYNDIEDMYADSDYVVSGTIKDISYFQSQYVLLRKINVLVNKSYKGNIKRNTLISVLENDGYLRIKSLYEDAQKYYREKKGDKEKEKSWLYWSTYMSDEEDAKNDMLIRYTYNNKEDSKVGDELLLFLTDTSDDTYKDKKVKLALNNKLSYPKGAYAVLGLWMGKFTKDGDNYKRFKYYFTMQLADSHHISHTLTESYAVEEMENMLSGLAHTAN